MMPAFIGIGAAKAGTTWLAACMRQHPQIFMPLRKEVNVFHYTDFDTSTLRLYEQHFAPATSKRLPGEFSTLYLQSALASQRIAKHAPDAKLIVSLRNPIEQVYSHYWHLRRQLFHASQSNAPIDFEQAIERYPHLLIEPALYHKHLRRWLDEFSRDQLLVVWFDDIVTDPQRVLTEVFSFLGVPTEADRLIAQAPGVRERRGVSPRSSLGENVYRPLYAALVRYLYNPMKRGLGPRLAANLKELSGARRLLEWLFFRPGYPPMTSRQREISRAIFRHDTSALERLLGRDLSAWR